MISAKIIAHSKSSVTGKEIVTFELEYPRFIHAEFMTHRLFSRNAASSRAIPVEKMLETINNNPAMPEYWGKNQAGMSAAEEVDDLTKSDAIHKWRWALEEASKQASYLYKIGVHKQIVNRLVEPFSHIKVVCTATEYDNFFHLRKHKDAQPEIRILAERMWQALQESKPQLLHPGEWHLPYIDVWRNDNGCLGYINPNFNDKSSEDETFLDEDVALKISASLCAQVSYRKSDDSLEKALIIYDRLVNSSPVHASPFEHQATPMPIFLPTDYLRGHIWNVDGITHEDKNGNLWSGNFKGWIQHRQLIPNNAVWEYKDE